MQKLNGLGVSALACILAAGTGPALAQSAAAPVDGLWGFVTPAVATLGSGLVGLAVTWAAARFHAVTGITIARKYQDDLHRAADTGIHLALDKAGVLLGDALSGQVKSAVIGEAMAWVNASVPAALGGLGVTPGQLRDLVAAKFNAIVGVAATGVPATGLPAARAARPPAVG